MYTYRIVYTRKVKLNVRARSEQAEFEERRNVLNVSYGLLQLASVATCAIPQQPTLHLQWFWATTCTLCQRCAKQ